jgi:Xaa-Pro dipeptidase
MAFEPEEDRRVSYKEPLPFPMTEYQDRIARVRKGMRQGGLDALLLTTPENVYYLSNHHTPAYDAFQALLLPLDGEPTLITPLIEELIGRGHSWVERFATYRHGERPLVAVRAALGEAQLDRARIGVEKGSASLPVRAFESLVAEFPRATLADASGLVEAERAVKSEREIAYIRQAAGVAEAGLRAGIEAAAVGRHDTDLAAAVHAAMFQAGGEYMSYPPFIAVGLRSSLAHNTWGGKRLESGEVVFLELSGVVQRYGAAIMRCVMLGPPPPELARRNAIVHEVLETTIQAIRPGTTAGDVDRACREAFLRHGYRVLKRAGYSMGINFPPGWGEGAVGDLSDGNPTVLRPGMVFHIPQPYRVPGEQTVATSETVLVTETGREVITQFPRELFQK